MNKREDRHGSENQIDSKRKGLALLSWLGWIGREKEGTGVRVKARKVENMEVSGITNPNSS